jgi:protein TonB
LAIALAPIASGAADPDAPPAGGVAIDATSSGPSVAERFATIQRRVSGEVSYPPIARAREVTGESQIEFAIDRAGNPVDISTIESSGSALLDRAAVRAVENAAPLPWIHGRIIVPVRFQLDDER